MALREERNEENQSLWHKRFERERLDLSASVEAALVVDSTLEQQWLDKFDEQDASSLATDGTPTVSPYTNRQFSLLPIAEFENQALVTTDARPVISSSPAHAELQEPRRGLLTRLAQRFTASFAAIDLSPKQEEQPSVSVQEKQSTLQTEAFQAEQKDRSIVPVSVEPPDMPLVRVIDSRPQPTVPVREDTSPRPKRSLKGMGKVRLETTELPVLPRATKMRERETSQIPLAGTEEAVRQSQSSFATERATGETWAVVSHDTLSGSGVCRGGQSEVMIACSRVTAASVVLVTLTSSPGPVVVQYISLQPRTGFTLHLTAPVSERTTFNYVVL